MSIAAIISGLLIWRALPPLFDESMSEKYYHLLEKACMIIGCVTIAGGIIYGFIH